MFKPESEQASKNNSSYQIPLLLQSILSFNPNLFNGIWINIVYHLIFLKSFHLFYSFDLKELSMTNMPT